MKSKVSSSYRTVILAALILLGVIALALYTENGFEAAVKRAFFPDPEPFLIYNQMAFSGNDLHAFSTSGFVPGVSEGAYNLTEWMITNGFQYPLEQPNTDFLTNVLSRDPEKMLWLRDRVVIDIETLRARLEASNPNLTIEERRRREEDIRKVYYDALKKGLPGVEVGMYNQNSVTMYNGQVYSDFIWLSHYRIPTETPEVFINKIKNRINSLPSRAPQIFVNTSQLMFESNNITLMPKEEFAYIVNVLISTPEIDGISFWGRVNANQAVSFQAAKQAGYFDVLREAVAKSKNRSVELVR